MKMKPNCLHILCEVEWPLWEQDGTREHHELKNSVSNLHSSHRRARTLGSISIYCLMARVSLRPSLDKVLYPEGKGKNINGTKID